MFIDVFVVPYLKNMPEKFKQFITKKIQFQNCPKPMNNLSSFIKTGKDKVKKGNYANVMYKINCLAYEFSYVRQNQKKAEHSYKRTQRLFGTHVVYGF